MKKFQPFRFWCQTVLPTVYDDSLSYLELLHKVVNYLNEIAENENTLVDSFNELKTYVNNYFSSTDFKGMVEEELDTMATDGTLDNIINNVLFNDLNERITTGDADTLQAAKSYADEQAAAAQSSALHSANAYTERRVTETLVSAGDYANQRIEANKYHNYIPYPYHNVYLDHVSGRDDNDGLSRTTAFKTLDRALSEADRWGDFRIWITASGEYKMSNPCINGITLHIIDTVGGVRITCVEDTGLSVAIYNCHINIKGLDKEHPIEIYMPDSFGSKPNQVLYFENCATTLNNVFFNSAYRLDTFGGFLRLDGLFKFTGQLVLSGTVCVSNADVQVENTRTDLHPIGIENGSTFTVELGTWSWANLAETATTSDSRAIFADMSTIIIKRNIAPAALTNKYYRALNCTHCNVIFSNARITLFAQNLSVNGNAGQQWILNGTLTDPLT